MTRAYVSMILSFLLTSNSGAAGLTPVGMVTRADKAHVGTASASVGTTLYEGDQITTEGGGELGIRSSTVALQLGEDTSVTLGNMAPGEKGMALELGSGSLAFSSTGGSAMVVQADGAVIRTGDDAPTIGHVRVVGLKELRIFAQQGALEFSYGERKELIQQGACYRVLLDAEDNTSGNSGSTGTQGKKTGQKVFLFVSIAVGAGVAAAMKKSHHPHPHPHESPDQP